MATVFITPDAQQQLEPLPHVIQQRILKLLHRLENWPAVSGAKALSGNLAGWYRMRTGDYRIRFRVADDTVNVDKIGHRKDVYDN